LSVNSSTRAQTRAASSRFPRGAVARVGRQRHSKPALNSQLIPLAPSGW